MSTSISRRSFAKQSAAALGALAASTLPGAGQVEAGRSAVYFTKDISVDGLRRVYDKVSQALKGRTAIKLHTGEPHGPNLLPIELIRGLQPHVSNSTIVECNVLYPGPRHTTDGHREVIRTNGFDFCPVEILDADGETELPIPGMDEFLAQGAAFGAREKPYTPGVHLREVAVGKGLLSFDSLLVYTHFKGHAMGGFGGSLKNIAIGLASGTTGKRQIHGDGWPSGPLFLERMVESGKAITTHFGPRIAYINVLKNLSVDCDCDGHGVKPTCPDIGIMASTDILAIDQASVDMVYALPEAQRRDLVERIESRSGLHQLEYMKALKMGQAKYELVNV